MDNINYEVEYWDKKKTKKRYEGWLLNGDWHREDGPAFIEYDKDGQVESEIWYLNGERHRKDGPAYIDYYQDGQVECECWYLNGKYHRENGPAIIHYLENRQIKYEMWCLNGKELSKERIKQLKLEIEADKCIEEMLNE